LLSIYVHGTLLGPEGSGICSRFRPDSPQGDRPDGPSEPDEPLRIREVGAGRRWGRPYLENCTVDASIFDICG